MSDLEDWELSDDDEPIVANLDAVDSLIQEKKKEKEEAEAAKNKGKTLSTLVVPTESELLEKFNALEDQQKAYMYKLLTVGSSALQPALSNASTVSTLSQEDEDDRVEKIRQENERIANMSESERKVYERQKQEESDLQAAMSSFGVDVKDLPVSTSAPKKVAKKKDPFAAVEKLEIKNMPEATRLAEIIASKLKILNKPNYVNAFLEPILACVFDVLSGQDIGDYGLRIGQRAKEKKQAEKQDFKKQQELKKKEEKQKKEKFKQNNDLFGGDDDFLDETPSYGSASNTKKFSKYDEDFSMF